MYVSIYLHVLQLHINKHYHKNYHNDVLCCINIYIHISYIISYYSTSCCLAILPPPRMPVANAGLVRDPQASPHLVTLDGIYRQVEGGQRCSAWLKPQLLSSFPSEIRRVKLPWQSNRCFRCHVALQGKYGVMTYFLSKSTGFRKTW